MADAENWRAANVMQCDVGQEWRAEDLAGVLTWYESKKLIDDDTYYSTYTDLAQVVTLGIVQQ